MFRVRPSFVPTFFILLGIALLGIILILMIMQATSLVGATTILIIQAIIALIAGFAMLIVFLGWLSTFYSLTNKRVDERFGIIGQHSSSINVEEISDVKLKIGILGQILGYGDIHVTGPNITASVDFKHISQSKLRASQVEAAMS